MSTIKRQVLIEKAPFLVEILDTPMSRSWWYNIHIGEKVYVRTISFEELGELRIIAEKYGFEECNPKDYYMLMKYTYIDVGIILKSGCKRVENNGTR
jgi:hypothetical protein